MSQNTAKVTFGQVILGPPGSGKTTYCCAIKEFLTAMGRKVVIVNLDPANDNLPFAPDYDISTLITLSDTMDMLKLGPNGGLIYCMEFLEKNFDIMEKKLLEFQEDGYYVVFDCPGQVELYTHHNSVSNIFKRLEKINFRVKFYFVNLRFQEKVVTRDRGLNVIYRTKHFLFQLVAVHLVDSHYCNDASKFISVLLTSLSTMLQIALPQVNVLSKIDLIEKYGKLGENFFLWCTTLSVHMIVSIFTFQPKKVLNVNFRDFLSRVLFCSFYFQK